MSYFYNLVPSAKTTPKSNQTSENSMSDIYHTSAEHISVLVFSVETPLGKKKKKFLICIRTQVTRFFFYVSKQNSHLAKISCLSEAEVLWTQHSHKAISTTALLQKFFSNGE